MQEQVVDSLSESDVILLLFDAPQASEGLGSGDRYVAEQKYQEAVVEYRNAIQQDPKFGEARYKLAETYAKLQDPRNAYREYIRAAVAKSSLPLIIWLRRSSNFAWAVFFSLALVLGPTRRTM